MDEELSELGSAVQSLAEAQKESAKQTQDMWGKMLDMVGPVVPQVVERLLGPKR